MTASDRAVTVRGVVLAVVLAGALAGCADAPLAAPSAPSAAPAAAGPEVRQPDADYARMMIPHHEQALELSALVDGRSSSPEVADLAFRIDREQVEEVGQLQGFLRLVAPDAPVGPGMTGMTGMAGMADAATLDRLRATSGPAFDRLWLETMIAHHEGALVMAREHLAATGGAGPLTEFSRTLLVSQQAEIDRMAVALRAL